MVIFPPHRPPEPKQDFSSSQPCFLPVTSLRESITDGERVGLTPACQQERKRRVWCTYTVCVAVLYSKRNWHFCACVSRCWTRPVAADSVFQGKKERGGRQEEEESSLISFLSAAENVSMHQSVWLLAQNPATHPHTKTLTHTHQGGKEAAKKARREVSRMEKDGGRRKEEGGGGHLVLSVHTHIHKLEEWENCLRAEL